ncbi:unnamed protein product [Ectocarpus sp. CCAP 1310/34]|nr:unnamed protein product [Ectocarpus sp. CCAP 1310/34]
MSPKILPLLVPLSSAWQARAFVTTPLPRTSCDSRAPQVSRFGAPKGATAAAVESAVGEVVKAEVWQGFSEEDHDRFLAEFWQKKPLLIRQAIKGFETILTKDELAGLSCCPDVEARVVTGGRYVDNAGKDWEVEHGPFEEKMFSNLGETHWTLLVNEVNRHVPEVSDLLMKFQFIPSWRVDDVMVSYAPKGGSVGPHVDNYDVFLLQGAGKRLWSIEDSFTSGEEEEERLVKDIDLRVLTEFKKSEGWVLEPGDALYLPPRLAHYGVSQDEECMTYSVGFRAPSVRDLVSFFGEHVGSTATKPDDFFQDPNLKRQESHGLISREAVSKAKGLVREALLSALDDDVAFDRWFGAQVTRSRRDHSSYPVPMDDEQGLSFGYQFPKDVTAAVKRAFHKEAESGAGAGSGDGLGPFVYHAEGLTFAFVEHEGRGQGATLFVDGTDFPVPQEMAFAAALVCDSQRLSPRELGPALLGEQGEGVETLLHSLLKEGYLYPADD